ncbi:MAG: DoxX family protein [Spirosomataceae bacterium]
MLDFFHPRNTTRFVDTALLMLRIFVPLLLIPHGYDKLLSFLEGAVNFPDPLHIGVRFSHALAVLGEVVAPLFIILGLFTRIAAVIEMGHFLVVAFLMHANEPLADKEHALLYLIPYTVILLTGAGRYSLDALFFKK